MSSDPIGFSGGLNLYNYPTNPITGVDPSGLNPAVGWAILAAIGLATEAWDYATGQRQANRMWAQANDKVKVNGRMVSEGSVVEDTPQPLRVAGLLVGLQGLRGIRNAGPCYYPQSIANGPKLRDSLMMESANSPFGPDGNLTIGAIGRAKGIQGLGPGELNNLAIPKNFGKFETETTQSPSGNYRVHFYMEPGVTVENLKILDLDYKVVLNKMSGVQKPKCQ